MLSQIVKQSYKIELPEALETLIEDLSNNQWRWINYERWYKVPARLQFNSAIELLFKRTSQTIVVPSASGSLRNLSACTIFLDQEWTFGSIVYVKIRYE